MDDRQLKYLSVMHPLIRSLAGLLPQAIYERLQSRRRSRSGLSLAARQSSFFSLLNTRYPDFAFSMLDVGARFGLAASGLQCLGGLKTLQIIGVEPDAREAARLEREGPGPYCRVYPVAVWDRVAKLQLHVTKHVGCTSVLRPRAEFLGAYAIAPWFEVTDVVPVEVTTLDRLLPASSVCDLVKVDVQGGEYQVLSGGADTILRASGIIVESHMIPIYEGEHDFTDLHQLVTSAGFHLAQLHVAEGFDGDVVELNCAYLRDSALINSRDDLLKRLVIAVAIGNIGLAELLLRSFSQTVIDDVERIAFRKALKVGEVSTRNLPDDAVQITKGGGFGGVGAVSGLPVGKQN